MNIADIRDAALLAREDVRQMLDETLAEWYEPDIRLQVAAAANAMALLRPEAIDNLDPMVLERLMEVTHAEA